MSIGRDNAYYKNVCESVDALMAVLPQLQPFGYSVLSEKDNTALMRINNVLKGSPLVVAVDKQPPSSLTLTQLKQYQAKVDALEQKLLVPKQIKQIRHVIDSRLAQCTQATASLCELPAGDKQNLVSLLSQVAKVITESESLLKSLDMTGEHRVTARDIQSFLSESERFLSETDKLTSGQSLHGSAPGFGRNQ